MHVSFLQLTNAGNGPGAYLRHCSAEKKNVTRKREKKSILILVPLSSPFPRARHFGFFEGLTGVNLAYASIYTLACIIANSFD